MRRRHDSEGPNEDGQEALHETLQAERKAGSRIPNALQRASSLAYLTGAATHEGVTSVTDVTLSRLTGVALINRPFTITV